MNIKTIYLDHDVIKPYCTNIIKTVICSDHIFAPELVYSYKVGKNRTVLRLLNVRSTIIGLNIESVDISDCYVCTFGFVISHFRTVKGKQLYPLLILKHPGDITMIIDNHLITYFELLSIDNFECDGITYPYKNVKYSIHTIVKINEFSPKITYHHKCNCGPICSFSYDNNKYTHNQYLIQYDSAIKLHATFYASKVEGICKRITPLLRSDLAIKDILLHIGMIMFYCI